jgi:hypothetical protein
LARLRPNPYIEQALHGARPLLGPARRARAADGEEVLGDLLLGQRDGEAPLPRARRRRRERVLRLPRRKLTHALRSRRKRRGGGGAAGAEVPRPPRLGRAGGALGLLLPRRRRLRVRRRGAGRGRGGAVLGAAEEAVRAPAERREGEVVEAGARGGSR